MRQQRRIELPLAAWPAQDRDGWIRETASVASLYGPGARAARLSRATVTLRRQSLGCWFGFLERSDELPFDTGLPLITPARLDRYVEDQRSRGVGNITLQIRLEGLHGAVRLLAPEIDVSFIMRPGGLPLSVALPAVPRDVEVRQMQELLGLANDLYAKGMARQGYAKGMVALRDAALIGILATSAPRRRSIHEMEIGRQVQKRDGVYWLCFEESNMKTGQRLKFPLPDVLTPMLDAYIQIARPAMGGTAAKAFWIGPGGREITHGSIYQIVTRRTDEAFGRQHGPHWFRTCLTTEAALDAPGTMLDVCARLGHTPAVSLKHYNNANAVAAAKRHDKTVSDLMDATRRIAERAFAEQAQVGQGRRSAR